MNYLAHLFLAGNHHELIVGGFLGDFVKGPLKGEYPEKIEKGIELHRRIDSWSDQHDSIRQMRELLPEQFGRYTAIIADVLCDHILASEWTDFSNRPLQHFCNQHLDILDDHSVHLGERARYILHRIKMDNWLMGYTDLGYCLSALSRIGQRLSRENPLHLLEEPVTENYEHLQKLCRQTLIDTTTNVAEWRTQNNF